MRPSHRVFRSLLLSLAVAVVALLGSPPRARASLGALVPAYFYPGTGGPGGSGDGWAALAAAAGRIPVTAIFDPNSGPLPGAPDPNYVTALTNLEHAGGHVVAYVYTNNGNAPIATVESQISTYISQYGSLINGFLLDGMFIIPSTLAYYQGLHSYIKGLGTSYTIIGNPGQPFLNGVLPTDYLSVADIFNIFEGTNASFAAYPSGLNWFLSAPTSRISNIVYDVPASGLLADVSKAYQENAGWVDITDQAGGNPYAQLPSYWDQEVSALESVPEPGAWTLMVSGGLCVSLTVAAQRLGRRRDRA